MDSKFKNSLIDPYLKDQFFQDGYITIKSVFDEESVLHMKKEMSRILAIADDLAEDFGIGELSKSKVPNKIDHSSGAQFVLGFGNNGVTINRVVGCGSISQPLRDATRHVAILNTVGFLLDSEELDQLICQFHPKEPNDNVSFSFHQDEFHRKKFDPDWTDIKKNGSYVVVYIAVDKANSENGGLSLLPGSHLENYSGKDIDLSEQEKIKLVTPELFPGSILIMHARVVHGSGPNKSADSRFSLLGGFAVPGANNAVYPGGSCVRQRIRIDGSAIN